jgi:hypothetical protein
VKYGGTRKTEILKIAHLDNHVAWTYFDATSSGKGNWYVVLSVPKVADHIQLHVYAERPYDVQGLFSTLLLFAE